MNNDYEDQVSVGEKKKKRKRKEKEEKKTRVSFVRVWYHTTLNTEQQHRRRTNALFKFDNECSNKLESKWHENCNSCDIWRRNNCACPIPNT